ncbi:hypothetical protein OFN53_37345, partial [Escherichia coli]|nr:hypothetical protein [Escherichia coli]
VSKPAPVAKKKEVEQEAKPGLFSRLFKALGSFLFGGSEEVKEEPKQEEKKSNRDNKRNNRDRNDRRRSNQRDNREGRENRDNRRR